jgi:hypothetical protein
LDEYEELLMNLKNMVINIATDNITRLELQSELEEYIPP